MIPASRTDYTKIEYLSFHDEWRICGSKKDGTSLVIDRIFREEAIVRVFREFLERSSPWRRNIFIYVPDPSKKAALIVECGSRTWRGFNRPSSVQLCLGFAQVTTAENQIGRCRENFIASALNNPLPLPLRFCTEILKAKDFKDLEETTQNAVLSLAQNYSEKNQAYVEYHLDACLKDLQDHLHKQETKKEPRFQTLTGSISYPFSDKWQADENVTSNPPFKQNFFYLREVITGVESVENLVSSCYLIAMSQDLRTWSEQRREEL